MTRTTTTRMTCVATAALALLAAASPAAAHQPVSAFGAVWVNGWTAATATVCAYGEVDDGAYVAGIWTLTVTAVRADGVPSAAVPRTHVGPTFGACVTVTTGALLAAVTGELTYIGAGTGDVTAVAGVVGARTTATAPFAISYTTSG